MNKTTVRATVNNYFAQNEGEELTLWDIAEKWGFNYGTVENAILNMRQRGEVELIKIVRAKRGNKNAANKTAT